MSATKLTLRCTNWTPIGKGSLVGKADIHVAELRLTFRGVLVLESNGRRWASLPAPAMLDRDGRALRDETTGKIKYGNIITFDTRQVRDAFGEAVIGAVLAAYPDAFHVVAA